MIEYIPLATSRQAALEGCVGTAAVRPRRDEVVTTFPRAIRGNMLLLNVGFSGLQPPVPKPFLLATLNSKSLKS